VYGRSRGQCAASCLDKVVRYWGGADKSRSSTSAGCHGQRNVANCEGTTVRLARTPGVIYIERLSNPANVNRKPSRRSLDCPAAKAPILDRTPLSDHCSLRYLRIEK